jgi:hypothetical protein
MEQTQYLGAALENLQAEEKRLVKHLEELRERIRGEVEPAEDQLREVRFLIGRMTGKKPGGKKRKKGATGGGLTTDEVVGIVEQLLGGGELERDEIKNRVTEYAAEKGRTAKGLHLSLRRALENSRFVREGKVYRLG